MSMNYDNLYDSTYREKRFQLVNSLREKGISDENVLETMSLLPREYFIERAFINRAYEDTALPISKLQTISQPFTVAYMTQLLNIREGDKLLEIGTGSGYQAAILSMLGAEVYSIERIKELSEKAFNTLSSFGLQVHCFVGDGTVGLPEKAPFDKIIVTAAAPEIPKPLLEQLTIGGSLVIPVGSRSIQTMNLIVRNDMHNYDYFERDTFKFVPLIGEEGWNE